MKKENKLIEFISTQLQTRVTKNIIIWKHNQQCYDFY